VSQVVVKQVVEQVATTQRTILNLMRTDPKAPFQEIAKALNTSQYTQAVPVNKDLMQPDIIYYFALLAMASLGASTAGAFTIVSQQANKSPEGARNTVSPTSKWTRVFANGLSTYTVQLATTLVVVGYITLVLGKSLGRSLPELLLIVALGTLMGVAMGMAIGALSRGNENMIVGFSVGAYMLSSFLGGLMSADIQRLVDTNLPWLAAINPGSMIVKALYSLFYYGQTEARYLLQMLLAILVFAGLAAISLRRRYHDSI
jgi:ABC-2 type transport system permease protein